MRGCTHSTPAWPLCLPDGGLGNAAAVVAQKIAALMPNVITGLDSTKGQMMTTDTESPARSELIGSVRPDPCSCIEKVNERGWRSLATRSNSDQSCEWKRTAPDEDLGWRRSWKTERLNSKPRGRSPACGRFAVLRPAPVARA